METSAYLALGLVVWIIYVSDRLLDVSIKGKDSTRFGARHEFHRKHAKRFRLGLKIAVVLTIILVAVPLRIPLFGGMLRTGLSTWVYGYAFVGMMFVAAFFVLSLFSQPPPNEQPYVKNVIAGITFAYGVAMLAYGYTGFPMLMLFLSPELICFAVLCVLNISAIDLWEHAARSDDPEVKASDELALTLPLTLLGAASLVFAVRDAELTTRSFFYATLTGAALLQILNRMRSRFSVDALRVLADVALLAPLLVFLASSKS